MIAVLFEARLRPGKLKAYLDFAAALRPALEKVDGFVSIERFASLDDDGRLLSLSYWRDEAAVAGWRSHAEHQAAQQAGRAEIFANYRLRIATVVRAYGVSDRAQAPADLRAGEEPATSPLA